MFSSLIISSRLLFKLRMSVQARPPVNILGLFLEYTLIYISVGILIGLDHLINEIRKQGRWALSIEKLILLGLPAVYLAFADIFWYSESLHFLLPSPLYLYVTGGRIQLFAGVILGYTVMTSFYKTQVDKSEL
ncbi:hypothetical protein SY88_17340 [Clostridiales bacterium PH28_bin88]|nr:hypothetical protein SY88_17340 [Clostridiales bacterium PH28_bin88]